MDNQSFVHLHVHTHYSLLDGANKVGDLVKRCKELGMDSIAISDHGAMFGVIEFYNECIKEGIKPIIGMEAYMAPGDRRERTTHGGHAGDAAYHLLLLAQNLEGYQNLLKLASTAYRDGFYYKPRIDKTVLAEWNKGIICTSACLGGEIPSAFMKRDAKTAKQIAETYLQIFGPERFYIEVQKQGLAEQDAVNPELVELAKKIGCGTVATNDVHFLKKEDHFAHDVLCCISMGRLVSDENRLKYPTELYLKSPAEMHAALGAFPEALANTRRIADQCNLELNFGKRFAPVYRVPQGALKDEIIPPGLPATTLNKPADGEPLPIMKEDERYLRQLCEQGLEWRYGTRQVDADIRERLEKELAVITSKSFCSYFLIVWDFCNYARDHGIPVGARGSGVGTMVGYLLGLCNVDPLKYGLLFERFMDPSRNEMPDIDIDICQEGRQKIIEYVRNKYGHVAQIITFGTLAARAACKDVGRVLGVPLAEIDKLTKLIPGTPGMTLKKALAQNPELAQLYQNDPQITRVVDLAQKLEGLCRNAGCHAAGVIIADQPIENIAPLYKAGDDILTQYEGPIAEKVGLLKMDFLGLRTLTTLDRALDLEHRTRKARGVEGPGKDVPLDRSGRIDIEKINIADPKVLSMFQRGDSCGVFQFESGGMRDLLMKMQPDRIEDLIAANALYRPGPMELIPLYCNRKHKREAVPSIHPIMDKILEETYGIMVYQEQVMQIFNQLGGIELANAYKLIKAISKKKTEVIAHFKPNFIQGATDKGLTNKQAEEIFELILKFGGYGFNKSHSTRYAIVAFQTGYMKTYHPVEYMSAVLTFEMGSTEKVVEYLEECKHIVLPDGGSGITVLPPDVNVSDVDFTPVYAASSSAKLPTKGRSRRKQAATPVGVIRFGLGAVKGVGTKAVESIIEARQTGEFKNLYDFCERIDLRTVNRSTIEALIKCGAFSSTGANRAQLLAVLDRAIEMGQQMQADRRMGQLNMFGGPAAAAVVTPTGGALPNIAEFKNAELLKYEKEALGLYITSHPLAEHQVKIDRYSTDSTASVGHHAEGSEVVIGGMIARVKKNVAKSGRSVGKQWAVVTLEDLEGTIDAMVFADCYEAMQEKGNIIAQERIVFIKGKLDKRRETPCLIANEVIPLEDAVGQLSTGLLLKLDAMQHRSDELEAMKQVLAQHRGRSPIYVELIYKADKKVMMRLDPSLFVKPSDELSDELIQVLGSGSAEFIGAGTRRQRQLQQRRLFHEDTQTSEPDMQLDPMQDPEDEMDEADDDVLEAAAV